MSRLSIPPRPSGGRRPVAAVLPGLALCLSVAALAFLGQEVQHRIFGHPFVEALVMAILAGAAIRTAWTPPALFRPGIAVAARLLLEAAVVLLGASLSLEALVRSGPALLGAVAAVVAAALAGSYGIARALGLAKRVSILIACGNSICGNSAIAAVAPVIGADGEEVASSIAFTAILGVAVVLGLPLLVPLLGLSETQYGILAGLTVYAVPQVLAATLPVGFASAQLGTLVKLVRVLLLVPLVLGLSLARGWAGGAVPGRAVPGRAPGLFRLVPWFILGFLALAGLRSLGLVPDRVIGPASGAATFLTVVAMAALGLGVDLRALRRIGARATAAVTLSLLLLVALSLCAIRLLQLP